MAITVDQLTSLDDLLACEELQRRLLGHHARSILAVPTLAAIRRSGGLLLGAWEREGGRPSLRGALVDLVAEADEFPARFTALLCVDPALANRGIAQLLRASERSACVKAHADVVFWWSDPLGSAASHVAFNKLGAIGTAHRRNALGPLDDRPNRGLATDRLRVEWWISSPRVRAILDCGRLPPHYGLGLDRMQVITKTTGRPSGSRNLTGIDETASKPFVLVEVPVDLERLRKQDPSAARDWRLMTRDVFELLFASGYTIVGFVHEGGRSFHLFEREDRGTVLGRSQEV